MEELTVQTKRGERKAILVKVDDELLRVMKHIAIDLDRPMTSIIDEAIRFWIIEYRRNEKEHRWGADE